MCGIAAISQARNDRKMDARAVATALLRGIESRGPDATGASWYDAKDKTVKLTKLAVRAARFIPEREGILPRVAPTMILHTRYGTHGSPKVRGNNHPIKYENVIGVHNGVLSNPEEVFKKVGKKPHAQVDSEAIMAMLSGGADPLAQFKLLRGDAAVAWIDLTDPSILHIARVTGRPVHLVQTKQGSLIMASTMSATDEALETAGLKADWETDLPEETYIKVREGVITDYAHIPDVVKDDCWTSQYSWTNGTSKKGGTAKAITTGSKKRGAPTRIRTQHDDEHDTLFSDSLAAEKWETYKNEWYTNQTTANLVRLADNGAKEAVRHLAERGLDEHGLPLPVPAGKVG